MAFEKKIFKWFLRNTHFRKHNFSYQIWVTINFSIVSDYILKNMWKGVFYTEFEKILRAIFGMLASGLISGSSFATFGSSIFAKTWKYYLYIYLVNLAFLFLLILEIQSVEYLLYSQIHTYAKTNFQKLLFWTQETKHVENFHRIQYFHYLMVIGY